MESGIVRSLLSKPTREAYHADQLIEALWKLRAIDDEMTESCELNDIANYAENYYSYTLSLIV
jgi:hypothetical protein